MKKMIVVIIVFLILFIYIDNTNKFTLLDYFEGEYTAYTSTKSDNSVDLGFCYMNFKANVKNVVGESIKIENFEPASAIKTLKAKIVKTEYLDDGTTVIYAITNIINNKVIIDNKYVNLQIAHKDAYSIIGWPLILGSF